MKQETVAGDWNLEIEAGKIRNSPETFYIPVDTTAGLRDAHETLKERFSEYGHLYGIDPHLRRVDGSKLTLRIIFP